ncbi:MAG: PepSY-associated TM helix domain-containing protein [Pseudomonadota bacterium]
MTRKTWFTLHSWCGLYLSLLMSFVLITGTLATISAEIDWLASPSFRADGLQHRPIDWGQSYEFARAHSPNARLLSINAPMAPWFATTVIAANENNERFRIYLDPVTNTVQGVGRWNNWQRFFRQVHRHLMLPIKIGVTIVGLLAIPLLIAFCSGTVIYRQWWRGLFVNPFKRIEVRSSPKQSIKTRRRYWGNVHRWLGAWSLWFILLIALTGIWYLLEQWGMQHRYPSINIAEKSQQQIEEPISGEDISIFVNRAKTSRPDLAVTSVALPSGNNQLIRIRGQLHAVLVRPRANQVTYNTVSRQLLEARDGAELSLHGRLSEAADPLHFGTFGGWPVRYLWFLLGAAMSTLAVSGVYLFGLRAVRGQSDTTPAASYSAAWRHMSFYRWPALIAIFSCLTLAAVTFGQ